MKQDRSAFNTLVREEGRLTGAGNVLATKTNATRLADEELILAQIQKLARRAGPIADALAQAARDIKDGKPRAQAISGFLDAVRRGDGEVGSPGRADGARGADDKTGDGIRSELGRSGQDAEQPAVADPLLDPEGAWRDETVTVDVDGKPAVVKAGTAVDFLNQRIKAVRRSHHR